ncbi:MAG: hypothetical protein R2704_07340 [Microthrixaceae bacterium]
MIVLRCVDEASTAEIAEVLELTEATVRQPPRDRHCIWPNCSSGRSPNRGGEKS